MDDIDTTRQINDREAGFWATRELVQRELWAAELGLDARTADVLALEPVPARQKAA